MDPTSVAWQQSWFAGLLLDAYQQGQEEWRKPIGEAALRLLYQIERECSQLPLGGSTAALPLWQAARYLAQIVTQPGLYGDETTTQAKALLEKVGAAAVKGVTW